MHMLPLIRHSIVVFGIVVVAVSANAQSPEQKGLEIATERKQRDQGWGDSAADMTMVLRDARGQESKRKMRTRSLEISDDGDKGLTIFDQPRDVKGTAFLSFSHTTKPDDQWIYLPALKRVKRIASRNKSGPFVGSEFAYEDMSSFELEKYSFKYLKNETISGMDCYVIEQIPVDKFSGYRRMLVWVDTEHYRAIKVEFYDRKNSLLKILNLTEYQQYLDQYWRPMRSEMVNRQTGKSTLLITHEITFGNGLKDKDFNKNTLKRAR